MSLQLALVFIQDLVLILRWKRWPTFYFRLPVASCISDENFECIERFAVSCTILLVYVFLWMSATSSCLQRSAAQLIAFRPQKQHWDNISSELCCKAGKSVRVINEVPLDSRPVKQTILSWNNPLSVRNYSKSNPPQKLIYTNTGWKPLVSASIICQTFRVFTLSGDWHSVQISSRQCGIL